MWRTCTLCLEEAWLAWLRHGIHPVSACWAVKVLMVSRGVGLAVLRFTAHCLRMWVDRGSSPPLAGPQPHGLLQARTE